MRLQSFGLPRPLEGPVAEAGATEPGARAFVWGVWGLLTLSALVIVGWFGSDVPTWDDYAFVPALVGEPPVTLGWLWEQCNEHRIALPKLILVEANRLAGNDVRAGMVLSVATLSALAAALYGRLRRLWPAPGPCEGRPGMLEDFCLDAIQADPALPCVHDYMACLQQKEIASPTHVLARARFYAWIASQSEPDIMMGNAAARGWFPWTAPAFDPLKALLQAL
ncbi:hypothetical protein BH23PLA1_BH23PLA1_35310 [soil metagenome]